MTHHVPDTGPRPALEQSAAPDHPAPHTSTVSGEVMPFRDAVRAWFLITLRTFGGPAGQISVMQRTLVDERRWIGQRRFLHALTYCMLLPGPEAHSSPSTPDGSSTADAADWSPAPCSSYPGYSL